MILVLHRLRDLAKVFDNLKLGEECCLTGDSALNLAVVLGQRSHEFRCDQAETMALIAGLSAYQLRARALFSEAISICEEVDAKDASVSSKMRLFTVLARAGCWSKAHPDRGAQWLKRAVQLITTGPLSTMVPSYLCSIIFNTYGNHLCALKQYADAVQVCQNAVSIQYTLVNNDRVRYTPFLVRSFITMGDAHCNLGGYHDAIAAYKAAEEYCRASSAQDPLQYSALLARLLHQYGTALSNLNQVSEAAEVQKEAISHCRKLSRTGPEENTLFCSALHDYGTSCHILGKHRDAVFAFTESIRVGRVLVSTDSTTKLMYTLHNMANSLDALGEHDQANSTASKALQMNQGRVLEHCRYRPRFSSCSVCQWGYFR
jgi:tetratricopeptide (TPR) repeat protein